jgi:hypothetical protein
MTKRQEDLVHQLRLDLLRSGYPPVYAVDNETLEAAEQYLIEWAEDKGIDPILKCGQYGLYFKGCELVIKVD